MTKRSCGLGYICVCAGDLFFLCVTLGEAKIVYRVLCSSFFLTTLLKISRRDCDLINIPIPTKLQINHSSDFPDSVCSSALRILEHIPSRTRLQAKSLLRANTSKKHATHQHQSTIFTTHQRTTCQAYTSSSHTLPSQNATPTTSPPASAAPETTTPTTPPSSHTGPKPRVPHSRPANYHRPRF